MTDSEYNNYKDLRNAAWGILLQYAPDALPVNARGLAESFNVTVLPYSDETACALVESCGFEDLREDNQAFSVYTDRWYTLYDETVETPGFSIAHELAHILLRHPAVKCEVGFFNAYYTSWNRDEMPQTAEEADANTLALRILAPACVLRRLRDADAETLQMLCGIPYILAEARIERINQLVQRDRFFTEKKEARVYELFKAYMDGTPELFVPE